MRNKQLVKEVYDMNPITAEQSAWAMRQFEPKLIKPLHREEDKRFFFNWFDPATLRNNMEVFRQYLCDASAHYDDESVHLEAAGDVRDELIEVIEVIETKWGKALPCLEDEEDHLYCREDYAHQRAHGPRISSLNM